MGHRCTQRTSGCSQILPYVICANPAVSVPIRVPFPPLAVKVRVLFNGTQMHTARSGIDVAGTDRRPAVPSDKARSPDR